MVEITAALKNKENEKKNEDSIWDLWDSIKCINIQLIAGPEEK